MTDPLTDVDRRVLAAAIRLGRQALGTTWPNPAVGAIVVRDGNVVGRGLTQPGGRPHAEPIALAAAGEAARGATLYVSLEPCNHYGRTPPCTDAILAAGIARVVVPQRDPDPRVSGRGLERLVAEGVRVACCGEETEARRAHAGHAARISRSRPFVLLKLAISADGAIGRLGEGNVPVSGETAHLHVHALRSRTDAILVGSGTVAVDDPALTCRLPGLEMRSPVRVIVEGETPLGPDRKVFTDGAAPTWVYSASALARHGAEVRNIVDRGRGGVDLGAVLDHLAAAGITNVLVEGGARIARSLLDENLADAVMLFRSPRRLGGEAVPALAGLPLSLIEEPGRFVPVERRRFGEETMTRYERGA